MRHPIIASSKALNPSMTNSRLVFLTVLALVAFAGNSVLCRFALKQTSIDPASFTTIRLLSGAIVLYGLLRLRAGMSRNARRGNAGHGAIEGNWLSGGALCLYAWTFSFAYVSLPTGAGALLLFGAVQATMVLAGWYGGERLTVRQGAGLALALSGLVAMLLPGLSAPPLAGSLLMLLAGTAWGIYSLLGRRVADPAAATTGNFLRAAPLSCFFSLLMMARLHLDPTGALYAVLSGVFASGIGYVIWYAALRGLSATGAASVQLSVPLLAALGGIVFLDESITLRLGVSGVAILGGIAMVVLKRRAVP